MISLVFVKFCSTLKLILDLPLSTAYLAVKLKKALAITREATSEIYLPQSFKPKIKKSFIALR